MRRKPPPESADDLFAKHSHCCGITRFVESGCKVPLPGSPAVTLSGTALQKDLGLSGKLCDLLQNSPAGESTSRSIRIAEAKSGSASAAHVHEQLQGGANLIQGDEQRFTEPVDFKAVLVHAGMKTVEQRRYARLKVRFDGRMYPIHFSRCGLPLHD
jgi:hypothetical protein